ncbi:glycosyl hydrolase family 15 [Aerophototrophica crusticola]|uniref:Glycosyl hydrolase family 15 n=1 Tax=Aerophototrophica crusticola TaxID=1709002 RepID=A0A858R4B5_9PROT|nr:glycosyl hydrolase family 15 [Rhodospirillaceae bacterium B3]
MPPSLLPLAGPVGSDPAKAALDRLHDHVAKVILSRQHPVTGLLPASTAVTVHGNYTHAWVRDNVYSIIGPWALALAYRRRGDSAARARLLEQSVVKTMRGLLQAMMKQAAKVERFKHTQDPLDSLHAIYSASTGEAVAPDDGWGHLQVDATSLFLLMLAQMTRSGLSLVYTMDEVAFVQNLVHYIGPAYRIADYGMWERGRKINDGAVELNASSIGMAKAALEALQGLDLFGEDGGRVAVVHAVPDEIARARATLEALLPRESGSKEVDAAVLSVIGWPAFAVEDPAVLARTRREIVEKLEGPWGAKRFLRDGHQTALEDHSRLHYEAGELERFRGIESEWPLFFTYQYVTALMLCDRATATSYRAKLDGLLVERYGEALLPELYLVPAELAEAERAAPGSQPRVPNENVPLLWAQSLYVLGLLLEEGLLSPGDVDPLGRRDRVGLKPPVPLRLVVLAEDEGVRMALRQRGIQAQTLAQAGGAIHVCHADVLGRALSSLGACPALGLTGRPPRRLGSLVTANGFRLSGQPTVFVPSFVDEADGFYFTLDPCFVGERLLAEVAYVNRNWTYGRPPLMVLPVTRSMAGAPAFDTLAQTLADLLAGRVPDLAVRGGELGESFAATRVVSLDGAAPGVPMGPAAGRGPASPGPAELDRLSLAEAGAEGWDDDLYRAAAQVGRWDLVRRAAARLGRHDERLQDAVKELVVRQKRVLLGPPGDPSLAIDRPMDNAAITARLSAAAGGDPALAMLHEEVLLFCGTLVKGSPDLFAHVLTVRPVDLAGLLVRGLMRERGLDLAAARLRLEQESPHAVLTRLRRLVSACPGMTGEFCLPVLSRSILSDPADAPPGFGLDAQDGAWAAHALATGGDWWAWRDVTGTLLPVPEAFFARVWDVLEHCEALALADPGNPAHRLDSTLLRADRTPAERDFAREVESRLDRIGSPEYRQLTVEALWAVSELLRARPDLAVAGTLATDDLLAAAVRRHWQALAPDGSDLPAEAWQRFYALSPARVAEHVAAAFLSRAAAMPRVGRAA